MQLVSLFQCRMTRAHFILIFHDLFLLYIFFFLIFLKMIIIEIGLSLFVQV